MTLAYQDLQLHENLHAGLRTLAAFDGKSERAVLHDIISSGIHSRMEMISGEWTRESQKQEAAFLEEDCLYR